MRDGMPSIRKRDKGTKKRVHLAPATANGWIAILKVICGAMTRHFELERDPSDGLEYFPLPRTYTREQPNALTAKQASDFLGKMREIHPQHYAMSFLGFAIGARPSTLRPLRRQGPNVDVLWDEGVLLLRRSHSLGKEIMDQTKTGVDQELPLTSAVLWALREHVASLEGKMRESEYLFPATTGGLRSRSALDKPFRDVAKALGWTVKITPRAMRRTFQDLARRAQIHDVVTRAISGHSTERMQRRYSTAQREEMQTPRCLRSACTASRPRSLRTCLRGTGCSRCCWMPSLRCHAKSSSRQSPTSHRSTSTGVRRQSSGTAAFEVPSYERPHVRRLSTAHS